MIKRKRDVWLAQADCPVRATVQAMVDRAQSGKGLRDIQIDAIKTYLFLKIACGNKPLAELFSSGALTSLELSDDMLLSGHARDYLKSHPASLALLEFSLQKEAGSDTVLATALEAVLRKEPEKIDAEKVFAQIFYNVKYPDYLFSLPMGAGKTYLMAAFIYLDLMYALEEPDNPAFAHNFLILAPSGTKSSIVPSLRTIENFDPAWVIPEPLASQLKSVVKFETLDADATAARSNQVRNPNVQKIARFQPYADMFGVVLVTNAEKVILDRVALDESGLLIPFTDEERANIANELRTTIAKIPSLAILIDEAHHTASQSNRDDEVKLRAVVNNWAESTNGVNSVLGFSGTPYLDKAATIELGADLSFKSEEIANTVYYYQLVRGVGDFLKKPKVTIVGGNVTSLGIVRRGVTEFFKQYGKTKYENGCFAKLAIYCGGIARLEGEIYPEVAKIVKNLGMDPAEVILKYHRGDKNYKAPEGAQLEFEQLDFAFSKKRVVLLVQIGKEGWDCRSLTGVVLAQEGDCPKKMVLQTSCRCLRGVDDPETETACIFLNAANGKLLEDQLKQQQHTTLEAFQTGRRDGIVIKRYDRTKKLELPPLPFYQLFIEYGDKVIESNVPVANRLNALKRKLGDYRKEDSITVGDFDEVRKRISTKHGEYSDMGFATTYLAWLRQISKESFGLLSVEDLKAEDGLLHSIFKKISVTDEEGDSVLSPQYQQAAIRSAIRRAFWPSRKIEIKEHDSLTHARLLDVDYLADHREVVVDDATPFTPSQKKCREIVRADEGGASVTPVSANVKKWQARLDEELASDEPDSELVAIYRSKIEAASRDVDADYDKTYHYLPYRTDSAFERDFLADALKTEELRKKNLEIYYNGDSPFTEFVIQCYRKVDGDLESVGRYTPDFLIISRDKTRKKIDKCLIVETKGKVYANDPDFKARREFMQGLFMARQNAKADCPAYEYLYLEEDDKWHSRLVETIGKFFSHKEHKGHKGDEGSLWLKSFMEKRK